LIQRKNGAKIFGMFAQVRDTVYILSGSNINQPKLQLQIALEEIDNAIAAVEVVSSVFKTQAWGNTHQPPFYNQVLKIRTQKNAEDLLQELLSLENKMGRVRKNKWEPRIIDLDILYFNTNVLNLKNLQIPHPYIAERRFTLEPLAEIAPDFMHPVLHKSNTQLLAACKDLLEVEKLAC
jgi:2-amino-4-hydroxy-6-hydroxymethyldihydropteridine diphosphokinase